MKFSLMDLLLPRETRFFDDFDRQVDTLIEAARIFKNMVTVLDTLSVEEIHARVAEVSACEHRGDAIELEIITALDDTFITPIDREDIHAMAVRIDQSLDILNSCSRRLQMYNIHAVPENVCKFAEIIVQISIEMSSLIDGLRNHEEVHAVSQRMHQLENEADALFYASMAELFDGKHDPVTIMKLKEIYEQLEAIVDSADHIGKTVRGIAVKMG